MTALKIERTLSFRRRGPGAPKVLHCCPEPAPAPVPTGRMARVARLLALAHRFDRLVQTGAVADGRSGPKPRSARRERRVTTGTPPPTGNDRAS